MLRLQHESRDKQVALVHDWLPVYGGAERVLEQFLQVYPESDLYSLFDFVPDDQRAFLQGKTVHTSFVQKLPFARKRYRHYLPLLPIAIEQFDLSSYDVVVSSSYVVAKGALTTSQQLHVSYVHSPIRYAWDLYFPYLRLGRVDRGLKSALVRMILHYLRLFDVTSTHRVDHLIANSRYVARRIWKTYRREADVIYPPVEVDRFALQRQKADFYVTVSRLVPYKRIGLIVDAFTKMPEHELYVIGDGPELDRISAAAGPNVHMLGYQPHKVMAHYLQHARGFVFAAEEDFGIAPVEAQACGTPVIAYGRGGALETVVPDVTGTFFEEQSVESLVEAVRRFEASYDRFEPERIRTHAERFSPDRFRHQFASFVDQAWAAFEENGRRLPFHEGPYKTYTLKHLAG